MSTDILESTTHGSRPGADAAAAAPRALHTIAHEIRDTWKRKDGSPSVNYAAEPYLAAMESLTSINEMYYADTAKSVVLYFLANANAYRGDDARRIKKELRQMAGL